LTNEQELKKEGQMMKHCVGSYTKSCQNGLCSIWSLRQLMGNTWKSQVTIEINRNLKIRQASARFNAKPLLEHKEIIKEWCEQENIKFN